MRYRLLRLRRWRSAQGRKEKDPTVDRASYRTDGVLQRSRLWRHHGVRNVSARVSTGSRYGLIGRWLARCLACVAGWMVFAAILLVTGYKAVTLGGEHVSWAVLFRVSGIAGVLLGTLWPIAQTRRRSQRKRKHQGTRVVAPFQYFELLLLPTLDLLRNDRSTIDNGIRRCAIRYAIIARVSARAPATCRQNPTPG